MISKLMNRDEVRLELQNLVLHGCNGKQCEECLLYGSILQIFCDKIDG